jgi:cell division protease FtsH
LLNGFRDLTIKADGNRPRRALHSSGHEHIPGDPHGCLLDDAFGGRSRAPTLKEVTAMAADPTVRPDAVVPIDGPERRMPTDVRDTLSWLAHLLDGSLPLRVAEDDDEFAQRHLGADGASLVSVREPLGPFTAPLATRALAVDFAATPPYDVAGLSSDESPAWTRLQLEDATETVPGALVAAFAAGTLLEVPTVISVDTRWQSKSLTVHVRHADAAHAERYLRYLMKRARGELNYLRGRFLRAQSREDGIAVRHIKAPRADRADVILSDKIWSEIDINVKNLFARRELLENLGLGTNRGLLLVGPPGTGKTALCRVLACELVGEVTIVTCEARAIATHLDTVYEEMTRLAPAIVILEDIDLVVGTRGRGQEGALHQFLTALDGAMSRHRDIVTIATTNDLKALDPAAVRAARFDRVIEVPLPDGAQRVAILRRYLGRLGDQVDAAAIGALTDGASGADLRELVRRAVLEEGEQVDTNTLRRLVGSGAWSTTTSGLYL